MSHIDAAFDDAYRSYRIQAGDDARTLLNPYARPSHGQDNTAQEAGGFVVDNEDEGGGFLPDVDTHADVGASRPSTLPLTSIPEALTNLGLDASDAHVLSIFADTAYTPSSAARRREKPTKVIGREEFRQVATVLLDQTHTPVSTSKRPRRTSLQNQSDGSAEGSGGARRPKRKAAIKGRQRASEISVNQDVDNNNEADADGGGGFIVEDDGDDSADEFDAMAANRRGGASDSGEEEFEAPSGNRRRQRTRTAQSSPTSADEEEEEDNVSDTAIAPNKAVRRSKKAGGEGGIRSTSFLNPLQRQKALSMYEMLIDRLPKSSNKASFSPSQRRIGVTELQQILQSLNEKLPEKEIEEMLQEGFRLFAPASASDSGDGHQQRKSVQAIKGLDSAQGIQGASLGLDEFAGILVHNRLL